DGQRARAQLHRLCRAPRAGGQGQLAVAGRVPVAAGDERDRAVLLLRRMGERRHLEVLLTARDVVALALAEGVGGRSLRAAERRGAAGEVAAHLDELQGPVPGEVVGAAPL